MMYVIEYRDLSTRPTTLVRVETDDRTEALGWVRLAHRSLDLRFVYASPELSTVQTRKIENVVVSI